MKPRNFTLDTDISEALLKVKSLLPYSTSPDALQQLQEELETVIWVAMRSFQQQSFSFDGFVLEKAAQSSSQFTIKGTAYFLEGGLSHLQMDFSRSTPEQLFSLKLIDQNLQQWLYIAKTNEGWIASGES